VFCLPLVLEKPTPVDFLTGHHSADLMARTNLHIYLDLDQNLLGDLTGPEGCGGREDLCI